MTGIIRIGKITEAQFNFIVLHVKAGRSTNDIQKLMKGAGIGFRRQNIQKQALEIQGHESKQFIKDIKKSRGITKEAKKRILKYEKEGMLKKDKTDIARMRARFFDNNGEAIYAPTQ